MLWPPAEIHAYLKSARNECDALLRPLKRHHRLSSRPSARRPARRARPINLAHHRLRPSVRPRPSIGRVIPTRVGMGSIGRKQEWMDNGREGGGAADGNGAGSGAILYLFQFPPVLRSEIRQQAKNAKIELELSVIEEDMGGKEVGVMRARSLGGK